MKKMTILLAVLMVTGMVACKKPMPEAPITESIAPTEEIAPETPTPTPTEEAPAPTTDDATSTD